MEGQDDDEADGAGDTAAKAPGDNADEGADKAGMDGNADGIEDKPAEHKQEVVADKLKARNNR